MQTPMGSHLLAYADDASRDADTDVRGIATERTDVFGPDGPPPGVK